MPPDDSPLALDADEMRRLGYRTVDMLVDRLTGPPGPVVRVGSPRDLSHRLATPPGEQPEEFARLLEVLDADVLPHVARLSHPGYLAFIPGEGTWPGALGDLIASALNLDTCWWLGASGPTALELVVLDWFRDWVGYPEEAAGTLVSGGSAANLTALACAREARYGPMDDRAVLYVSDQAHSSLARAARVLGFRPEQVRVVPSDRSARIRVDALRAAIEADEAVGRRPLAVVANAGSTTTGAVDPLRELSDVCRAHGDLWLHVDGAYGAFACLTDRGRAALDGMALADSITLDPHKWLYQPIEVGALLVREGAALQRSFEINPDYLEDVHGPDREVNLSDRGLQLTRTCRAVKVWLSVRTFGLGAFREAIDRCLDLAVHAQQRIEASTELELETPASLGVVTFSRRPPGVAGEARFEAVNQRLVERIAASGDVFVSTSRVEGRLVLRLCVLNHSTTVAEIDRVIDLAETLEIDTVEHPGAANELPPGEARLPGRAGRVGDLRSLPLFAGLSDAAAERLRRSAREVLVRPGRPIVAQWEASRDLYVVVSGDVRVDVDGREARRIGPGDVFGEMAALDWGASFGRIRTATVSAATTTRLLVLDWELVTWLSGTDPTFEATLERVARERLGRR